MIELFLVTYSYINVFNETDADNYLFGDYESAVEMLTSLEEQGYNGMISLITPENLGVRVIDETDR